LPSTNGYQWPVEIQWRIPDRAWWIHASEDRQQKGELAAIPPGWGSEYLEGMLNRVMVVVLPGCVGLTAGVAFGTLFPSYDVTR
jgi:hypothetical protein